MDESIIRSCVLFFTLALDDEDLVYPCSELALTQARRKQFKNMSQSLLSLVINESTHLYLSKRYNSLGGRRPLRLEGHLPKELVGELRHLKSKTTDRTFVSFVWKEVVKAPRLEIAKGLGISEGTVDHRAYEVLKVWGDL